LAACVAGVEHRDTAASLTSAVRVKLKATSRSCRLLFFGRIENEKEYSTFWISYTYYVEGGSGKDGIDPPVEKRYTLF
jgi:hypothetical protein